MSDDHPQLIRFGRELSDEEYDRLRDLWEQQHTTRTLYLDPRWDWVDVSPLDKGPGTEYVKGQCNHLEIIPVESVTGETVAGLCLTCDAQLPAALDR